jgi:hypothetical protein
MKSSKAKSVKVKVAKKPAKSVIKLLYYTDPGHGWVRVPLKSLAKLGIADKISRYSYVRTVYAYLEEDNDYSVYLEALKATGKTVEFVNRHTDRQCRIRSYSSYASVQSVVSQPAVSQPVVVESAPAVESVPVTE